MIWIRYIITISILTGLCTLSACHQKQQQRPQRTIEISQETLMETNRHLLQKDDQVIASYIERRQWDMETTQTGLRYMIYQTGSGETLQTGDEVRICYSIALLDGTNCYRNDTSTLVIGYSDARSGVQQALLLMQQGSKAKLIVPPHLGYGLIGDEERIPARSILVYDLEVLNRL